MLFANRKMVNQVYCRSGLLFVAALFLFAFTLSANAGLFGLLSKAGKLGKGPDIDIPSAKLELPDHFKEFTAVTITPDGNGHWLIKQSDGTFVRFHSAGDIPADNAKPALILRGDNLPDSLDPFDSLPTDVPVLIRGKKGHLFELQRSPSTALVYKRIRLSVSDINKVHSALWLLQRPSGGAGVRFVEFSDRADTPLPEKRYGSRLAVEKVGRTRLLDSMDSMKRETVVLSGRIEGGQLFGVGAESRGITLSELRQSATDNDIKLLILESDTPSTVLKQSARSMDQALKNSTALYDTVGDLYSRLSDSSNRQLMDLHISSSGQQQMAIHWQPPKADVRQSSVGSLLKHLPAHALLHSMRLYTPDESRGRELDSRIIPGIHSWVQYYLISSVVLGFIAIGTSYRHWCRLWGLGRRKTYRFFVVFLLFWLIHKLLFVVAYMPLLGTFSFVWLVLSTAYKILHFLMIRPVCWLYRLITA